MARHHGIRLAVKVRDPSVVDDPGRMGFVAPPGAMHEPLTGD
jgi:hypothetical protein